VELPAPSLTSFLFPHPNSPEYHPKPIILIAAMPGLEEQPPFKVLIVGGSYSGLAATLNLIDLCHGRKCRFNLDENEKGPGHTIPVQVTIVDERDGYCM
jgi:hypothetical protein